MIMICAFSTYYPVQCGYTKVFCNAALFAQIKSSSMQFVVFNTSQCKSHHTNLP